jgi:2-methylcitrate dehydratase
VDRITRSIAELATALDPAALPAAVVHDCKRRILDTIGCALAAFDAEPARIARGFAMRVAVPDGATIVGTRHRTLPELAAFANSVASRYIEGNDTFPGGGGHPSDCLLPILGVAEACSAPALTAIAAVVLGYEAHAYLFRAFPMRKHALDYVPYTAVASAIGAAKVLGLSLEATANAVSLALVPNLALDIARRGHLTMWKGAAAPNAARNGITAAYLAQAGMSGPGTPFEDGLTAVIGPPDVPAFPLDPVRFAMLDADFKYFLSEFHAQAPIFAAIELHPQVRIEEIEKVEIFTYRFAWHEIGSGTEKWHPTTRETADHSMPYIVACVLIDGAYSDAIYTPARYGDTQTLALMQRITVTRDAEFDRVYPSRFSCRIEITTRDGARRIAAVPNPIGHHDRPMSDVQVAEKFNALAGRALAPDRVERILERLWQLETEPVLAPLMDELARDPPP